VFEQPNDPTIPLLIGDCVHCLRQALDHLAYSLAIVVNGSDPPVNWEKTQFPITTSPDAFKGGLPDKIGRKKLMPDGLYEALEGIQPYKGPNGGTLLILHGLDNVDKHRFVPVVAAVGHIPKVEVGRIVGAGLTIQLGPIEDEEPFLEFIPEEGADQHFQWTFTPSIAFDRESPVAGGKLIPPLLRKIRNLIRDEIFPTFEAFL
jgi:hypothetical protein